MIHVHDNKCPICLTDGLSWNLNHCRSQMEMFKCGHGTCKDCFHKLSSHLNSDNSFTCPLCRGNEQKHRIGILTEETGTWKTFAEWYSEFEVYIKAGAAKNVVKHSNFGRQLLRLVRETRNSNSTTHSSNRK